MSVINNYNVFENVWSSCEDGNRIIIDRFDEVILNFSDGYILSNSQKSGYGKKTYDVDTLLSNNC